MCGRREIISAVALQHLDQDVLFDLWDPPRSLVDKRLLPGLPQHGIGRPCKVGKEQIAGLITALQRFVAEGDEVRRARWDATVAALMAALAGLPHAVAAVETNPGRPIPSVRLKLDEAAAGMTAMDLVRELMAGDPSVHVNAGGVYDGELGLNPTCLREGDVTAIARRLRECLERARSRG